MEDEDRTDRVHNEVTFVVEWLDKCVMDQIHHLRHQCVLEVSETVSRSLGIPAHLFQGDRR